MPRPVAEGADPPAAAFEQAVAQLYARVVRPHLLAGRANPRAGAGGGPALPPAWTGAEVWCQTYEAGRGLDFHYDKDEAAMAGSGAMRNPAVACVVYLVGDRQPRQPGGREKQQQEEEEAAAPPPPPATTRRLGPTVIIDQRWVQGKCGQGAGGDGPAPPTPTACALAWPVAGAVAVFAGTRAHGVLSSPLEAVRAALLVNFWAGDPPGGVGRAPAAALAGLAGPVELGDSDSAAAAAADAPFEEVPARVTLPPPPAAGGGGAYGHALAGVLAGLEGDAEEEGQREGAPPPAFASDLLVVSHAGYDLVEADGGSGPEAAWVVGESESEGEGEEGE